MLQTSIATLDGSLMAINRTSSWEVLCTFCLMKMSHLMEVPRVLCKCHARKKYFQVLKGAKINY